MTKKINQALHWAHLLTPAPGRTRIGFNNILDWMGLTWGNTSTDSGWTTLTPSGDSRLIYVSSSGNNANDGLTSSTPKQTVAAGKALLRDGYPDWLQLKCGDTFDEALGDFSSLSGRSLSERMVITSYGSGARPILRTGTSNGISAGPTTTGNYLALVDVEMTAHLYDGSNSTPYGIYWLASCSGLLVEGCYIHNYQFGAVMIDSGAAMLNVSIRRNVIADINYTAGGNACSGLYLEGLVSPIVEENVLDKASWMDDADWTIFFHAMYVHNTCVTPIVRNNLVANGDGIQVRPGGTCTGNVISRVRNGIEWGLGTFPNIGGITGNCDDNVLLEGHSPGIANADAQALVGGITTGNVIGGTMARNIVANHLDTTNPAWVYSLAFSTANGYLGNSRGVNGLSITDFISCDAGGTALTANDGPHTGNAILRMVGQNPNVDVCHGYYPGPGYDPEQVHLGTGGWSGSNATLTNCHFSRNAALVAARDAGNAHQVDYNGTSKTFANLYTDTGATGCDASVQTYPHNTAARLGDYYTYLGNADQGSNDANHAALMALCRAQRKGSWDTRLTATSIRSYIVNYCFGSPW